MIASGSPQELAELVHSALCRRTSGVRLALVLRSKDEAILVGADTNKCRSLERAGSVPIAGYYIGSMNKKPRITVDEIHDAIVETIKWLA